MTDGMEVPDAAGGQALFLSPATVRKAHPPPVAAILSVQGQPGTPEATLTAFGRPIPARVGRVGLVPDDSQKKEGDHATPTGTFALRTILFRPDRMRRPLTGLPVIPLTPHDRWCDDPEHVLYNRPVTAPFPARCELLWREDRAYDVVGVLDANLDRPVPGAGSAIFFHLTTRDRDPHGTEGCVAISPPDMAWLLPRLGQGTVLRISVA